MRPAATTWDRLRFMLRWYFFPGHRRFFRDCPEAVLFREFRGRIAEGPFRGMCYLPTSSGSALAPKLLGCYERELHPALLDLLARCPETFIDVGAAEGYYAVGVPWLSPSGALQSYAVDTNAATRDQVQELAAVNGVSDRVHWKDSLDAALAQADPAARPLVLCDVEGDELRLLDPLARPALTRCDLVVEVHVDDRRVSPREALEARFRRSHHGEWIPIEPRTAADAKPARWCRDGQFLLRAVDERRVRSIGWLVLRRLDQ